MQNSLKPEKRDKATGTIHRNELLFSLASGLAALAVIVSLPHLVAKPKLLFGRSLSAMEPTLFPYIILSLILALSILAALFAAIAARRATTGAGIPHGEVSNEDSPLVRVAVFFVMLVAYGLLLKPVGFLLSSFIVITVVSLLLGNRNWWQIIPFAVLSPVLLYLLATRVLLVSLPELNLIELFYAGIFNRFGE